MNENWNNKEKKAIIDKNYYQNNKEKKKDQRRKRNKDKILEMRKKIQKYSQVENYKVLMTLREYTQINKDKQKKWLGFCQTLKELAEVGIHNVSEIMWLCELGGILVNDYWTVAKKEEFKGKFWNSISDKKRKQLITLWAREKVRLEEAIAEGIEMINDKAKEYEKEIEMAKFHEERGKVKCQCWQCSINDNSESQNFEGKQQCSNCGKWVKKLDEENGVCKSCVSIYND